MNSGLDPDEEVVIQYTGSPIQPSAPKEQAKWHKFLKVLCDLAGGILETEIEKRAAAVRKTNSETMVNLAQAKKIAAETAEIARKLDEDSSKLSKPIVRAEEISEDEMRRHLGDEIAELEAEIERLRLLHGTEIRLKTETPVGKEER